MTAMATRAALFLFSRSASCSLLASGSVVAHLARGATALLLGVWALANADAHGWLALAAGGTAVFAMRGCPMCWTIGLVETVVHRLRGGRD